MSTLGTGSPVLITNVIYWQLNGKVLEQGSQFSLEPVEVITSTIDLEEIEASALAFPETFKLLPSRITHE